MPALPPEIAMPHARPHRAVLVAALLAVAVFALSLASVADAKTRTVRVSAVQGSQLVFKTRGVSAKSVRAARLKVGRKQRSLRVSSVRRNVKRGKVVVRAPKSLRRKVRKVSKLRKANAPKPVIKAAVTAVQTQAAQTTLLLATGGGLSPRDLQRPGCPSVSGGYFVSPSGDDSNPGTASRPWQTIEKAESEVRPGDTIVLRGGSYGAWGKNTYFNTNGTASAPINVVAYPGETPVFPGQVAIGGDYTTVCGMLFRGGTGPVGNAAADNPKREMPKVWIAGDHVTLQSSEVTGAQWHAGVYLEADNARIIGNYIHDNGQFDRPEMANLDHGLYWAKGHGGLIEGNTFEHNFAHAVQLYPNVSGVTVRNNRMTGQGRAAVLLCDSVSDNVVEDNDIYGNRRGIQGYEVSGHNNVARGNRLWNNAEGDLSGDGVAFSANDAR
jgi:parallel beta-helix repeat protein